MNQDINSDRDVTVENDNVVNTQNEQVENQDTKNDIESLTVNYNDLYKLESNEAEQEKIKITDHDIQFDNADYIQDENIIRKNDIKATKKNLKFMAIIVAILILIIIFVFPYVFKIGFK